MCSDTVILPYSLNKTYIFPLFYNGIYKTHVGIDRYMIIYLHSVGPRY